MRRLTRCLAIGLIGLSTATLAAELPNRAARPAATPAKACEINGQRGMLTAGGVCLKLSGYVSAQFSLGNPNRATAPAPR